MFNYKKRLSLTFLIALIALTAFTSSVEASSVPSAPGLYVGASKSPNLLTNTSSVRLSFADNSDNEDGFYVSVYDSPAHNLFTTINVNASNNAYQYANITGLTCNQTYQAVVVAYNDEGNSTESDYATFNMESTFGAICNDDEVPNQPGPYIGISDINRSAVRINFDDNSNNETGFRVFDGDSINVTLPANDESSNINVYTTLTGLTCDKLYTIKAVAFNSHGDSLPSDDRAFNIHTTFGVPCDGENQIPIANAGADQTVEINTTVQLDGSGSSDSDGDSLTYTWSFVSEPAGSTATLDDFTSENPSFTATVEGDYTLKLIVNDGQVNSPMDTVTISSENVVIPPALDPTTIPATIFD